MTNNSGTYNVKWDNKKTPLTNEQYNALSEQEQQELNFEFTYYRQFSLSFLSSLPSSLSTILQEQSTTQRNITEEENKDQIRRKFFAAMCKNKVEIIEKMTPSTLIFLRPLSFMGPIKVGVIYIFNFYIIININIFIVLSFFGLFVNIFRTKFLI